MLLTATLGTFHAPVYNNLTTNLSAGIDAVAATVPVLSTTNFPTSGVISIGTEVISYTGKTSNTFTGCTRGFDNTTGAAHSQNALVELRWIADHHNTLANEVIRIEDVLGESISTGKTRNPDSTVAGVNTDYTNLDARVSTFEDYEVLTSPPLPASGARFGSKCYVQDIQAWYAWNGTTWDILESSTLTPSSDDWDLVLAKNSTLGPNVTYLTPKVAGYVNNVEASMFATGTISNLLNTMGGFGALGRDGSDGKGNGLTYLTPNATTVSIVSGNEMTVPLYMSLNIDTPVVGEVSTWAVVPQTRNIKKIYITAIGDSDEYVSVNISKVTPPADYDSAVVLYTIGTHLTNSITPVMSSASLGDWNGVHYSISAGDIVYARVTSVTGSPGRITTTIEAPYVIS